MLIPYIFKGGSKAKALEVNENFKEVQKSVEENKASIEQLNINLDTKANINGNTNVIFSVAESNTSLGATNLQQVQKLIKPFQPLINNLLISKTLNPLEIVISQGSCYDSTYKYVINTTGAYTLQLNTYTPDITQYIYLRQDIATNNPIECIVASTPVSPTLPTQSTIYRKIGEFMISNNTFSFLRMVGTRCFEEDVLNVQ